MKAANNRWFTIVATDLFSGSFAAILLIDALTPKEIGSTATSQRIEIQYPKPAKAECPADSGAIVLAFKDGGTPVSTLSGSFSVKEHDDQCIVSGFLNGFLESRPEDPCIVVAEYPGGAPSSVKVSIASIGFNREIAPDGCK